MPRLHNERVWRKLEEIIEYMRNSVMAAEDEFVVMDKERFKNIVEALEVLGAGMVVGYHA